MFNSTNTLGQLFTRDVKDNCEAGSSTTRQTHPRSDVDVAVGLLLRELHDVPSLELEGRNEEMRWGITGETISTPNQDKRGERLKKNN